MTDKAGAGKTKFLDRPGVRNFVGHYLLGGYVWLATVTSRVTYHPADYAERVRADSPVLYVVWHANMTAIGPIMVEHGRTKVLVSPHPDGRMGAAAIIALGGSVIYGTGATERQSKGTRGVAGSLEVLKALAGGESVLLTADVPPRRGRRVSQGVIRLARLSGRPIVPVALASSNRSILTRIWDEMQVNHPFSAIAVVGGEHLLVDERLDDDAAAAELKTRLDTAYARALELTAKR